MVDEVGYDFIECVGSTRTRPSEPRWKPILWSATCPQGGEKTVIKGKTNGGVMQKATGIDSLHLAQCFSLCCTSKIKVYELT